MSKKKITYGVVAFEKNDRIDPDNLFIQILQRHPLKLGTANQVIEVVDIGRVAFAVSIFEGFGLNMGFECIFRIRFVLFIFFFIFIHGL